MNDFDIKQENAWHISFIICHQHQTRSQKIKANKTENFGQTNVCSFFVKNELQHI